MFAHHIGPNTEQQILSLLSHQQSLLLCVIGLPVARSLVLILTGNLLWRHLSVHFHILKNMGANVIELFELQVSKNLGVFVTPLQQLAIIQGHCFTSLELHGADHLLGDLSYLDGSGKILVWSLSPLSNEVVQISFTIDIR